MLQNLRLSYYHQTLQQQLNTHQVQHRMLGLQKAQKIGILFDGTDENNLPTIHQYTGIYEQAGKKVSLLGFIDSSRAVEQLAFPTFSRKELNWYFQPTHETPLSFANKEFDILINAFLGESLVLEYISTFSKAKFRVGPYLKNKHYCFDFMINIDTNSLDDFMKNTHHYLQMLDNSVVTI